MAIYWFILCLILLFVEIVTINLVSIWFAIGAFAAMICALVTDTSMIQLLVFIVVSIIALLVTKPFVKKFRKNNIVSTNFDRVIGKTGDVIKKITPDQYGEVKVLGSVWTASSDEVLEVGEKVKVKCVEGVKLIVKKEEK